MCDVMMFPDTAEEFIEQYKIVDTDQVYTNGAELIPIFRMRQWLEHLQDIEPERKTGRWIKEHIDITDKEHPKSFRFHRCSVCGHVAAPALFVDEEKWLSYCPHCGAYMGGEQDEAD